MPVATNPLLTGEWTYEYSTNQGSNYTAFATDVIVDVIPDPWVRKVIERMLIGQDVVLKHLGKINYGNLRMIFEYHSALFNTLQGWLATQNTEIYIRAEPVDTGGTNDSRIVYKGYVSEIKPPQTPGDDVTAQFELVIALNDIDWTAAA